MTFKTITIWTTEVTIDKNALGLTHQGQRHVRRIIDTYMIKWFRTLDKWRRTVNSRQREEAKSRNMMRSWERERK